MVQRAIKNVGQYLAEQAVIEHTGEMRALADELPAADQLRCLLATLSMQVKELKDVIAVAAEALVLLTKNKVDIAAKTSADSLDFLSSPLTSAVSGGSSHKADARSAKRSLPRLNDLINQLNESEAISDDTPTKTTGQLLLSLRPEVNGSVILATTEESGYVRNKDCSMLSGRAQTILEKLGSIKLSKLTRKKILDTDNCGVQTLSEIVRWAGLPKLVKAMAAEIRQLPQMDTASDTETLIMEAAALALDGFCVRDIAEHIGLNDNSLRIRMSAMLQSFNPTRYAELLEISPQKNGKNARVVPFAFLSQHKDDFGF